jgi:hypothetical protein
MRRVILGLLCVGLLAGGCASGIEYKSLGPSYPPRGTAEGIKIFDRVEPPEPYDRIGTISGEYQRRKFTPPRLHEIQGEVKQKAYDAGGDAVIVRNLVEPPYDPDGVLKLQADVVRFKR